MTTRSSAIDQTERLSALFETELLDSPPEAGFDRLTRLACKLLKAPVALVSLVDDERQYFKSQVGLPPHLAEKRGTPLSHSFCKLVVESQQVLVIGNVPDNSLVCDNPILQEVSIQAYAGVPITSEKGHVLGSLCVIDTKKRQWTEDELDYLIELAGAVETEIRLRVELRRHARTQDSLVKTEEMVRRDASKAALVDILQVLIRNTPQAIAMVDREMRYVAHSRRWTKDYALDLEDLTGLSHYDVFPETPERFRDEHCRAMGGERIQNVDDQFVRQDGRVEYVSRELVPWSGPDGKIGGILILSEVLTEERRTNLELQRTLEQVKATKAQLRQTIEALITTQKISRVERWTWDVSQDRMYRHSLGQGTHEPQVRAGEPEQEGLFPREFSVPDFLAIVESHDRERLAKVMTVAKKLPGSFSETFTVRFAHGKKVFCRLEAVPSFDGDGQLTHYTGSLQDQTRQHELETQLFQNQKLEALGQMASGIAHDFNNVLTIVQGFADKMRRKMESDNPFLGDVAKIRQGAEQGGRLVQQLLLFARKKELGSEPVDVNEMIENSCEMFRCYLKARITLETELEASPSLLIFNRSKLEQLLLNFVGNAGDAIDKQGRVLIRTANVTFAKPTACADGSVLGAGDYLQISIIDNGSGIGEERLRIFEPLFTTKGEGQGTGLGLSVCSSIVREAMGAIDLDSEIGVGTTFTIYLPLRTIS